MNDSAFELLFHGCATTTGTTYTEARAAVLALGDEASGPLRTRAADEDWRISVPAQALLLHLTKPDLAELVDQTRRARFVEGGPRPAGLAPTPAAGAEVLAAIQRGEREDIVPKLIEAVTKAFDYRTGDELQVLMLALEYIGDRRAVAPLVAVVETTKDALARLLAVATLGGIGDKAAAEPLRKILNDKRLGQVLRGTAAIALGRIGVASDAERLRRYASDGHWTVRRAAVDALGLMGDQHSAPILADLLAISSAAGNGGEDFSLGLVGALARMLPHPAAVDALTAAGGDTSHPESVRAAARYALRELPSHGPSASP